MRELFKRTWETDKPVLFITVGGVLLLLFVFLLRWKYPDLSTDLAAFGTLTLAIIGAFSINQNRTQEKNRRKQLLVAQIVEWAVTLLDVPADDIRAKILHASSAREQELDKYNHIVNMREHLQRLFLHAKYYESALTHSESHLKEAITGVIQALGSYIEFLENWQHMRAEEIRQNLPDKPELTELATSHESALRIATDKVILAAAGVASEAIH